MEGRNERRGSRWNDNLLLFEIKFTKYSFFLLLLSVLYTLFTFCHLRCDRLSTYRCRFVSFGRAYFHLPSDIWSFDCVTLSILSHNKRTQHIDLLLLLPPLLLPWVRHYWPISFRLPLCLCVYLFGLVFAMWLCVRQCFTGSRSNNNNQPKDICLPRPSPSLDCHTKYASVSFYYRFFLLHLSLFPVATLKWPGHIHSVSKQ